MPPTVFISTLWNGITHASLSQTSEWQVESLLLDKQVRCLSVDPHNVSRVYAGTQGQGVLRSDDKGKTWNPCGLSGYVVKAIAASPIKRDVVYAGTKPALMFVSQDGGETWRELEAFRRIPWRWLWLSPAEKPFIGYVQAIALSPTDPGRIAVGIEAGATVLSRNGGQTWTRHRKGALRDCHALTFHATQGQWLYEGGGTGGGAAVSRDAGRTWTSPKEGLDRHYGWAVAADPERPEVWYLSVSPGAFKAHSEHNAQAYVFRNDGTRWERLGGDTSDAGGRGLPQPLTYMPYALLTEPGAPGHLYAGLSNGDVWHSADYGEHWQQMPFNLGRIDRALVMLVR